MPTYDEISEEILEKWVESINSLADSIRISCNKETVAFLIMNIYEYIAVYTAYQSGIYKDGKYRGGLTTVKKFVDHRLVKPIMSLMGYANNLRHSAYKKTQIILAALTKFEEDSLYTELLKTFFGTDSSIYKLLSNSKVVKAIRLEVSESQSFRRRCRMLAKDMLSTVHNGESKYTVGEVVNKMVKAYNASEQYAKDIVFELISNQVVSS